ncbi:hypothetical protein Leryth_010660 [Lithospermum erythrorhizon]|nr:hypothetical protein Leryth_010660 [Lithospermum erythrorhizon]
MPRELLRLGFSSRNEFRKLSLNFEFLRLIIRQMAFRDKNTKAFSSTSLKSDKKPKACKV